MVRGVSLTHEVAPRRTEVSPSAVRGALARAFTARFGAAPSTKTLDVLTAHVSHETARGERMFNFNFGGIKGASPSGATARYTTHEVLGGADTKIVDGFRAYRSIDEGARDYLGLLKERYPKALDAARRGDADGFTTALADKGYFTASRESYAAAMRALSHDGTANGHAGARTIAVEPALAVQAAPPLVDPNGPAALPTTDELARVLDAVASMTARIGAPTQEDPQATERGAVR